MARHVHVHIHPTRTRDAGFDESAHPRDHGKFTSAGGGSSTSLPAAAVKALKADHADKMAVRNNLAKQHGPDHPGVKKLDAEMSAMRSKYQSVFGSGSSTSPTSGGNSSSPAKKGPVDRETTVGKAAHQLSDAELHDRIQGVAAKHREWVGKSKRGYAGAKEKADEIHQQLKVLQAHQANRKSGFTPKRP